MNISGITNKIDEVSSFIYYRPRDNIVDIELELLWRNHRNKEL